MPLRSGRIGTFGQRFDRIAGAFSEESSSQTAGDLGAPLAQDKSGLGIPQIIEVTLARAPPEAALGYSI